MYKDCNVVMLATDKQAPIFRIGNWDKLYDSSEILYTNLSDFQDDESYQHLYITSDEEIKEGDWIFDNYAKINLVYQVRKCDLDSSHNRCDNWEKIIATTDTLLIKGENVGDNSWYNPMPTLSQSFINTFISEYNKGNVISKVNVEYEQYDFDEEWSDISGAYPTWKERVKLTNNTINIQSIKDCWTREEVIELFHSYFHSQGQGEYATMGGEQWLNNNLK